MVGPPTKLVRTTAGLCVGWIDRLQCGIIRFEKYELHSIKKICKYTILEHVCVAWMHKHKQIWKYIHIIY